MQIMDISKRFIKEDYNNNMKKLINDIENGIFKTTIIDNNNIVNAFCGYYYNRDIETARQRFKRFMLDNINIYSVFYDMKNHKILSIDDIKNNNF